MKRFLIQQGGVYYLTTGDLLQYDEGRAKSEEEKKGLKKVKDEFQRIHDQPHTWYKAVEITDSSFSAVNTGV
jgi:hypothetical protein